MSNNENDDKSHVCPECGEEMEDVDFELCDSFASDAIDELMEHQGEVEGYDFVAAMFSMFMYSIHILNSHGWTAEELTKEIDDHIGAGSSAGHTIN